MDLCGRSYEYESDYHRELFGGNRISGPTPERRPGGGLRKTMSTDARRPNKPDGTTDEDDEPLTMAQLENALHQRHIVVDCRACGSDATLTRDDLYFTGGIARLACDDEECFWEDLIPHQQLCEILELPDDLEIEQ
jgi:hypothetical protein